jgi:hypothetical protein
MLLAAMGVAGAVTRPTLSLARDDSPLSASARIYETTTLHNSFPDGCDSRLQRLYIAEGLQLAIEVQFNRALSDQESQQVQWSISNGAGQPDSGDFVGQANPALVTATVTPADLGDDGEVGEALVSVTFQGADLVTPMPVRVISDAEYSSAYAVLSRFTSSSRGANGRLPLTSDLLSRFLGQDSSAAGMPTVRTSPLNMCDPRLTHRAGANWGADVTTEVPLVQYASDQPAGASVGEGVARAVLAQNAQNIRQYFAANPGETTYAFDDTYSGNLTLDLPLDANFALHGVQFDGMVSARIDGSGGSSAPLTARTVRVVGTVADLYDFNLEASGAGAFPATEAAKIQIASVKHDIGKVFLVAISLDTSVRTLRFDPGSTS